MVIKIYHFCCFNWFQADYKHDYTFTVYNAIADYHDAFLNLIFKVMKSFEVLLLLVSLVITRKTTNNINKIITKNIFRFYLRIFCQQRNKNNHTNTWILCIGKKIEFLMCKTFSLKPLEYIFNLEGSFISLITTES